MKNSLIKFAVSAGLLVSSFGIAQAGMDEDVKKFQSYFLDKFSDVKVEGKAISRADFADGVYAILPDARKDWKKIEEFPPYEFFVEDGQEMWETPFANGKTYKDCFPDGPAIAGKYPHWDKEKSMVMTLPLALNNCRVANGEKPLKYKKGSINNILSYIAFESRGQVIDVKVPVDDPKAVAAYNEGKHFWSARRGQLNMSCAACHGEYSGQRVRADTLSPALGQVTGFPVFRSKWGTVGTLHRRFSGCNKNVRAKPFKAQGEEYRNLEYFLSAMSNGMKLNGPSFRK